MSARGMLRLIGLVIAIGAIITQWLPLWNAIKYYCVADINIIIITCFVKN